MSVTINQIIVYAAGITLFVLLLRYFAKKGERLIAERRRKIELSPKAKAKIIDIGKSRSLKYNGAILVKLRLEIFPAERGREPFQTSTAWEVEPAKIGEIAVGKTLPVKYDEDEKSFIYPRVDWAKWSELYRNL